VIVKAKKAFGVKLDQGMMVVLTLEQMAKEIDNQLKATSASTAKGSQSGTNVIDAPANQLGEKTNKKGILKSLFGRNK